MKEADDGKTIVTVTLNPAVDHTAVVRKLEIGRVNRVAEETFSAGGKGVNVSVVLARFGVPTTATGFLGRENEELFVDTFARWRVLDRFLRVAGRTRTNMKVLDEETGDTTDINGRGPVMDAADWQRLVEELQALARPGRWFVFAGREAEGMPAGWAMETIGALRGAGCRIVVDAAGDFLKSAVAAGVDLAKPNRHELGEWCGRDLPDEAAVQKAAEEMRAAGVARVIVSMDKDGALFVGPEGVWLARPLPVEIRSSVGAGDALLAGYLARLADDPEGGMRLAMVSAWSVLTDGGKALADVAAVREAMDRVRVEKR